MAEVVSTGVSHMCDNSTVSVKDVSGTILHPGFCLTIHVW